MDDKLNYNLKTADDVTAERVRLQAEVKRQEEQIRDRVDSVTDVFSNPIAGITSLFSGSKKSKPVTTGVSTTVNLLVGRLLSRRLGFLSSIATPFISKTISEQVMAINAKPYAIAALDWVIDLTDEKPEVKLNKVKPTVWKAEAADLPHVDFDQPTITPKLPKATIIEGNDGTVHIS